MNGGLRVLVVDDDADNRKLMTSCLALLGDIAVLEAHDALAALRLVLEHEPDLILLDMDLPLLDGYRAAGMIRLCSPRGASVPIVALTADSQNDVRARCLRAGATDYVSKPVVDPSALRAKLAGLLAHSAGGAAPPLRNRFADVAIPARAHVHRY